MLAIIQRVNYANVAVNGQEVAAISRGILALIGFEKMDNEALAKKLVQKILSYCIFQRNRTSLPVCKQTVIPETSEQQFWLIRTSSPAHDGIIC